MSEENSTSVTITMTGEQAVALHSLISEHVHGEGRIHDILQDIYVAIALNVDFGYIGSVEKSFSILSGNVNVSDWEFVNSDHSYAFSTAIHRGGL